MITGAGLDLFDISRMEREIARQGTHLLDELFSGAEQASCAALSRPARGLAARFAIKEACFKALGTGMVGRMCWRDIETSSSGRGGMTVSLAGDTARVASNSGVRGISVAFTVTRNHAVAWAVAEGTRSEEGADAV
ncbi:MAG: holo-ACP synthase [Vicinamibacterales bacterium]|nr:holo-ACP synthase [Vicinamibacterales bacterium]